MEIDVENVLLFWTEMRNITIILKGFVNWFGQFGGVFIRSSNIEYIQSDIEKR